MSILVEFVIAAEQFELGKLIADGGGVQAELERIVPTEDGVVPYAWVTGTPSALDATAEALEGAGAVTSVEPLEDLPMDRTDNRQRLFRLDWRLPDIGIIRGLNEADGVVLEGYTVDDYWSFRLRFPDHEHVARFYQHLTELALDDFRIERVYELQSRSERDTRFDLTPEQREAITMAAREGYFDSPRAVTLSELGAELGISEQAFSQRLRAATEEVVCSALDIPEQ